MANFLSQVGLGPSWGRSWGAALALSFYLLIKMFAELIKVKASDQVGNRWSKEEIQIFYSGNIFDAKPILIIGFQLYGPDYKRILNDLIEEDFTSRTYDNVKAFHIMVSSLPIILYRSKN